MPLSPKEMEAAVIKNLPVKTGKTLDEWVVFAKENGPTSPVQKLEWLKNVYKLGHVQASIILGRLEKGTSDYGDETTLINNLFSGENTQALLLYESMKRKVLILGKDVNINLNRTYISFSRNLQFLVAKPSKGVLIIGLALSADIQTPRLAIARNLGAPQRINFQLSIRDAGDIDDEFIDLIKQAYHEN